LKIFFVNNYLLNKGEMKKIDCKGGKATVLWGISDKTAKVQTLKLE